VYPLPLLAQAPPPAQPPAGLAANAPPSLADALTGSARTDYDIGKILYRDGDYVAAQVKFQAALDTSKDARLLWNLAACEKGRGHFAQVMRLVQQYRKEADAALTDAEKQEADALLVALKPHVASLRVVVSESDARVLVDDQEVGKSPLETDVLVDLGTRRLQVIKAGFVPYEESLVVGDATEVARSVTLKREVHEGRIVITARSEEAINIDDKVSSLGRLEAVLPAGPHILKVSAPGKVTYQSEVTVRENQTRTMTITLESEKGNGLPLWLWLAGGAVVAGGASVAAYFVLARPGSGGASFTPVGGTAGSVTVMGARF
jgi:hypothetical protein